VSVLFGRWNFDGKAVAPEYLEKVRVMLGAHSPDGVTTCAKGTFAMLYGALHVTAESRREWQPTFSPAGTFLSWDGRLDNRTELIRRLGSCNDSSTDLQIVASCLEQESMRSLGQLIGDWSLSLFNHYERTLILAKDFLGTRPLYYHRTDRCVVWSSLLDPLVLFSDEHFTLCEEYLAGWLAGFPEAHLTPYEEVRAVPPSSFVKITSRATIVQKFWDFRPRETTPLKSDAEYEECFRTLFSEAVRRRLRSGTRVLAQLSGGMDSSAIVCAADTITRNEGCPLIETVSYFDDGEPNWNERPYFTAVEALRGRTGLHLNVAGSGRFFSERDGTLPVTPAHGSRPSDAHKRFAQYLSEGGFRVLLSGTGGDEFTGGVPTGTPELADLLSRAQFGRFLHRAFLWAMASRKPLFHEVGQVVRAFLPALRATNTAKRWPMPWLNPSFVRRNQETLRRNSTRFHWLGPLPTFQENLHALDGLRRQIACAEIPPASFCQMRYPFLDRNLLEFLFNVPREQLVRPHQRRSLLRRALRGIVPSVVLDRRRKAFVVTSQLKAIAADWKSVSALTERMVLESLDILDSAVLRQTLEKARQGNEVPLLPIMRALRLEQWLQDPEIQGLFSVSPCGNACAVLPKILRRGCVQNLTSSQLGNPKTKGGDTREIR